MGYGQPPQHEYSNQPQHAEYANQGVRADEDEYGDAADADADGYMDARVHAAAGGGGGGYEGTGPHTPRGYAPQDYDDGQGYEQGAYNPHDVCWELCAVALPLRL